MANYNEQVLRAWDEWEALTGQDAGNPDDFIAWAMENRKLAPHPQDISLYYCGQPLPHRPAGA